MSLKFGGRRYATRGHFGSAPFKRGDISMTHWWSQRMRIRWGRSGWKVTTSGVTCSLSLVRGVRDCSRDTPVALPIPCVILSPSWSLLIKFSLVPPRVDGNPWVWNKFFASEVLGCRLCWICNETDDKFIGEGTDGCLLAWYKDLLPSGSRLVSLSCPET